MINQYIVYRDDLERMPLSCKRVFHHWSPTVSMEDSPLASIRSTDNYISLPIDLEQQQDEGCPVKHSKKEEGCPVTHKKKAVQYNVYSQPIDPTNQMPVNPNNKALYESQAYPLSQERVKSSIPKGGSEDDDETWNYPSPQMFYNSVRRKGKVRCTLFMDFGRREFLMCIDKHQQVLSYIPYSRTRNLYTLIHVHSQNIHI